MRKILRRFGRVFQRLDNRDVHVYGGLALAAVGGCVLSWVWTCVAVGTVLILFGLFGALLDRVTAHLTEDAE